MNNEFVGPTISFIFFIIFICPSIYANAKRNSVAARGNLRCFNRPFQGRVWLMYDRQLPGSRAMEIMDSVLVNAEGSFELLGRRQKETWGEPFYACIFLSYNCVPPKKPPNSADPKNQTQMQLEMEWERKYYEEEEMEFGWAIEFWKEGETKQAKNNDSAFKDWNEPIDKSEMKKKRNQKLGIDNKEDETEDSICIHIPDYYFSQNEVPERFFELGTLNLSGKIRPNNEGSYYHYRMADGEEGRK